VRLTIYGKPGCHLCDEMKMLVHRVVAARGSGAATTLDEVDISTDRELLALYGLEIPVLLIDGTKVAKYRVSEKELRRILEARSGS
jgi:glutaredoxin